MKFEKRRFRTAFVLGASLFLICAWVVPSAFADGMYCDDTNAVPGGTLSPCDIPKYEIPLVIPPVMNNSGKKDQYKIAVRQFQQQILPGGIWNTLGFTPAMLPPTTVWSYGPAADSADIVAPDATSQFNYPAYTIETKSDWPVEVRWINDLVDSDGNFLPHLLPIDQTVHWANPPQECRDGSERTDCAGKSKKLYKGPVPIVTHVHGAHVDPHSDGYPEAWWLPRANDIPEWYATKGRLFDDATGNNNGKKGYADYRYRQDQPATTLWYHDHSLGMTRSNVYAGPAGFWLIRGGKYDQVDDVNTNKKWDGRLPGPAAEPGDTVLELNAPGVNGAKDKRSRIREISIAIQDRSFNEDGSLFYPANRAFFEGLGDGQIPSVRGDFKAGLKIHFAPKSDVLPTWNPEAFFNVMVVNGAAWPQLEVAPAIYRFRLLDGCNSRFINLSMFVVKPNGNFGKEIPFYQIGAEQGFLPKVVEIVTGYATPLPGNGKKPKDSDRIALPDAAQALTMGLAERADVLVDFRYLPDGTMVRMINTAPDEPFGGDFSLPADPETTGQVMQFVVNKKLLTWADFSTTPPWALKLNAEHDLHKAENAGNPRNVSLNERESEDVLVCANADGDFAVPIVQVDEDSDCLDADFPFAVPFGPTEALLGTVEGSGESASGVALKWTADGIGVKKRVFVPAGNVDVWVTENPNLDSIEEWDIYNFTVDAHPIHMHLVRFEVVERTVFNTETALPDFAVVLPWEKGFKDTVIAYPGQITKVKAKFDIEGLYVWHCHIVEHEDNEMMRPYFVGKGEKSHEQKKDDEDYRWKKN